MFRFSIGVIVESFRMETHDAIRTAAKMGAKGLQMYCTTGEHAPENFTKEARRELLSFVKDQGLCFSAICGDLGHGFGDAGMMGDIYYSKATYLRQHGNPGGWFGNRELSGGGPVIDLGVHVIDQTRFLMGNPKPVSVFAMVSDKLGNRADLKNDVAWKPDDAKDTDPNTIEDFGTALIRYDNGAVTLLECSYDLNGESVTRKDIYGTKGGVALGNTPKFYTSVNGYLSTITPRWRT